MDTNDQKSGEFLSKIVVVGPNRVFVFSTARGQEKDHNLRQAFTIVVYCILLRS
jgi:hypothetical protein